ncbi:MAG: hypothetical protein FWC13_11700 [Oscillospiraceae bacterium]|nr:hypothetical protein [Oscillospiraceae bacterium]
MKKKAISALLAALFIVASIAPKASAVTLRYEPQDDSLSEIVYESECITIELMTIEEAEAMGFVLQELHEFLEGVSPSHRFNFNNTIFLAVNRWTILGTVFRPTAGSRQFFIANDSVNTSNLAVQVLRMSNNSVFAANGNIPPGHLLLVTTHNTAGTLEVEARASSVAGNFRIRGGWN